MQEHPPRGDDDRTRTSRHETSPEASDDAGVRDGQELHDAAMDGSGVVANPVVRGVLSALGWISVGLGAIGIVLPGWPTTVWLLVAAFFFARSNPRFYRWLLRHRLFGPFVRDIRAGLGLPTRAKVFAISMIVLFAGGSSVLLGLQRPWLGLLVASVGTIGILYILRMPTRRADA